MQIVSKQFGSERIWSGVMQCKDGQYLPLVRHSRRNGLEGGCRRAGLASNSYQVALERSWLATNLAITERTQRGGLDN